MIFIIGSPLGKIKHVIFKRRGRVGGEEVMIVKSQKFRNLKRNKEQKLKREQ